MITNCGPFVLWHDAKGPRVVITTGRAVTALATIFGSDLGSDLGPARLSGQVEAHPGERRHLMDDDVRFGPTDCLADGDGIEAVGRAEPDVIVHQMTSLAGMGFNLPGKRAGPRSGPRPEPRSEPRSVASAGDGPPRGDHDPRPFRVVPQHKRAAVRDHPGTN